MTKRTKASEASSSNVDEYRLVLLALLNVLSVNGRIDTLNKVFIQTEDSELKQCIWQALDCLRVSSLHAENSNAASHLNFSDHRLGNLYNYCSTAMFLGKPQWQILAERNGWRPPPMHAGI